MKISNWDCPTDIIFTIQSLAPPLRNAVYLSQKRHWDRVFLKMSFCLHLLFMNFTAHLSARARVYTNRGDRIFFSYLENGWLQWWQSTVQCNAAQKNLKDSRRKTKRTNKTHRKLFIEILGFIFAWLTSCRFWILVAKIVCIVSIKCITGHSQHCWKNCSDGKKN